MANPQWPYSGGSGNDSNHYSRSSNSSGFDPGGFYGDPGRSSFDPNRMPWETAPARPSAAPTVQRQKKKRKTRWLPLVGAGLLALGLAAFGLIYGLGLLNDSQPPAAMEAPTQLPETQPPVQPSAPDSHEPAPMQGPAETVPTDSGDMEPGPADSGDGLFYYCRSLLSPDRQAAYDMLYAGLMAMEADISLGDISDETGLSLFTYVQRDHPEVFWIDGSSTYYSSSSGSPFIISPNYTMSPEERNSTLQQVEACAQPVIDRLSGKSDYEKVLGVYEHIINNTVYDLDYYAQDLTDVMLRGRGVCTGYATTLQYLLQKLGVPVVRVTGFSRENGESHSWSVVRIEGDYYYVDATWGDPLNPDDQQILSYSYLNFTTEDAQRLYVADDDFPLPQCTQTRWNYYSQNDALLDSYSYDSILAFYSDRFRLDQEIYLRFASEEAYQAAFSDLFSDQRIQQLLGDLAAVNQGVSPSCTYHYDDKMFTIAMEFRMN